MLLKGTGQRGKAKNFVLLFILIERTFLLSSISGILSSVRRSCVTWLFLHGRPKDVYFSTGEDGAILLITVAFNNLEVIRQQFRLLRKYLAMPYKHVIVDNSTEVSVRQTLRLLCESANVDYYGLKSNPFSGLDPSMSHGLALQWALKNVVINSSERYFGFIDHDIFPYRPTNLAQKISTNGIFGHVQDRGNFWYLWPGFCFFDRYTIAPKFLNFLPDHDRGLDTGGRNWAVLSTLDRSTLVGVSHSYLRLGEAQDVQNSSVELIGDWVHTFNASGWMSISEGRAESVINYLEQF